MSETKEKWRDLLENEELKEPLEIPKIRKRQGFCHNTFDQLGLNEMQHSKFIAYLLNPREKHGQQALFLKNFLHKIMEKALFKESSLPEDEAKKLKKDEYLDHAEIQPEEHFINDKEQGRHDISIRLEHWFIVIENKIDADEGEDQIAKYQENIKKETEKSGRKGFLIFLTPDGRDSTSANKEDLGKEIPVILFSYVEFGEMLEETIKNDLNHLPAPSPLRYDLEQYASTCKRLKDKNTMTEKNEALLEFIKKNGHAEAFLELAEQADYFKEYIIENLIKKIEEKLKEKFNQEEYKDWKIGSDPDWGNKTIGIVRENPENNQINCIAYFGFDGNGDQKHPRAGWKISVGIDKGNKSCNKQERVQDVFRDKETKIWSKWLEIGNYTPHKDQNDFYKEAAKHPEEIAITYAKEIINLFNDENLKTINTFKLNNEPLHKTLREVVHDKSKITFNENEDKNKG